jgi:hypothetical protein
MLATRTAKSKRMELEHLVISYAAIKGTISADDDNDAGSAAQIRFGSLDIINLRWDIFDNPWDERRLS